MRKCPYCGTENKDEAFRCKNEDCSEILPQNQTEETSNIKLDKVKNVSQAKNTDRRNIFPAGTVDNNVSIKRVLKVFLGVFVLVTFMFGVMSYSSSCDRKAEERSREYAAERNREHTVELQRREAAEHAREYWGKRYEGWDASVGHPQSIRGKRGELGVTPIYYPSLGITVIVNDDNQIIHVEDK
jgi:hypothetical protein